jgi:hypothetical protein
MSTFKSGLAYLAVLLVLSFGSLGLASQSVAAVPEKASSQQEEIGSASAVATPSAASALQ